MKHKCMIDTTEVLSAMGADSIEIAANRVKDRVDSLARYRAEVFSHGPLADYIDVRKGSFGQ